MWIGEIDFPDALTEAAADGSLVVFAGAGLSKPPPSRVPTFRELVQVIASESGTPIKRSEPLDRYLGRIENDGYPARQRVEQLILDARSPNKLHESLVGLFRTPDQLRIVTTNFDRLLTDAAAARWSRPIPEYVAPALPLGATARGIVYLHGAVDRRAPTDADPPSAGLILTDGDFGHAYLTQGFARRFLVDLFSDNVVLFVGYSHQDAVLTYLARGLPPGSRRYALTRPGMVAHWHSLGVAAVPFPTRSGRRQDLALTNGLNEWGAISASAWPTTDAKCTTSWHMGRASIAHRLTI